jgi:phosphoglycolate phosphatase-like HAD superfamily hydrolase
MLKALALDFDGVIFDGLNECVLVTWYGHHGGTAADFGSEGLSAVPSGFVTRFAACRAYAKHLGHFYLSFSEALDQVQDQAGFDALYAAMPAPEIEAFVVKVTRFRALARDARRLEWLNQQQVYRGMDTMLSSSPLPVYIVTAKDAASVLELLQHVGVSLERSRVFGELRDKLAALKSVCEREHAAPHEIGVVDDNVLNALAAKNHGYTARWALWGYQARGHREIAQANDLRGIEVEQLLGGSTWVS